MSAISNPANNNCPEPKKDAVVLKTRVRLLEKTNSQVAELKRLNVGQTFTIKQIVNNHSGWNGPKSISLDIVHDDSKMEYSCTMNNLSRVLDNTDYEVVDSPEKPLLLSILDGTIDISNCPYVNPHALNGLAEFVEQRLGDEQSAEILYTFAAEMFER